MAPPRNFPVQSTAVLAINRKTDALAVVQCLAAFLNSVRQDHAIFQERRAKSDKKASTPPRTPGLAWACESQSNSPTPEIPPGRVDPKTSAVNGIQRPRLFRSSV